MPTHAQRDTHTHGKDINTVVQQLLIHRLAYTHAKSHSHRGTPLTQMVKILKPLYNNSSYNDVPTHTQRDTHTHTHDIKSGEQQLLIQRRAYTHTEKHKQRDTHIDRTEKIIKPLNNNSSYNYLNTNTPAY